MFKEINELKKMHNAIIIAHNYQLPEVQDIADIVGDSLMLSRKAAKTDADLIIFCGVHFMAESAKILSPNKKIILPVLDAGCPMADMIDAERLKAFKLKYPSVPVICYVNSSAEVKALCDVTCTSSNALSVVKGLGAKRVLFAPDRNLGSYIDRLLPDVEVISYQGYCPVHEKITEEEVIAVKHTHSDVKVLAHPECNANVLRHADFIGSTSQIIQYVNKSVERSFIIGTEMGIIHSLTKQNPAKTFYPIASTFICEDMKKITLEDVYKALKYQRHIIEVDPAIAQLAIKALDKMVN